jgi:hypothetical protein
MSEDLHGFVTTALWTRLKADINDLRIFNHRDLVNAAYFHVRRLLLVQPGWSCRAEVSFAGGPTSPVPDLTVFHHDVFRAVLQLEFHLSPGRAAFFPAQKLNESMAQLRRTTMNLEQTRPTGNQGSTGRGYLVGVFETDEEWFYPDQTVWEKQSCFWLPVNCREMPEYAEWRPKWEALARPFA